MKLKKQYVCSSCGSTSSKWSGQCFECQAWSTINEEIVDRNAPAIVLATKVLEIENFNDEVNESVRIVTPLTELNRVLGGGFVPGSVTLIGGDPGVGKSTLLLQLIALCSTPAVQDELKAKVAGSEHGIVSKCLYVSGEESADQIKLRATRLGFVGCTANILAASNIDDILSTIEAQKFETNQQFDIIVIDSIQTMYSSEFASTPGTVTQIKACTHLLINFAKKNNVILVLVGHVTKDGQLAGPKLLEHMVDTVLYFEGDQYHHYRILRSVKNRYGAVNEIGVFEMTSFGLDEITNPSEAFLMQRENNVSGTCVFAGLEGSRPLLVEIQALIAPSNMPMPKRSVVGWDTNRLSMILAVLNVRFGLNLADKEVYLSVAGGLKITEPAVDLAVAAALVSAAYNKPLPEASVFFGEIGLSGEVRKVSQAPTRIKEAMKQGYQNVYCTPVSGKNEAEYECNTISHIKQLKQFV